MIEPTKKKLHHVRTDIGSAPGTFVEAMEPSERARILSARQRGESAIGLWRQVFKRLQTKGRSPRKDKLLLSLIEECIEHADTTALIDDVAFCKVHVLRANLQSKPAQAAALLGRLHDNQQFPHVALFYRAWAIALEQNGDYTGVENAFAAAMEQRAQPMESLLTAREAFHKRLQRRRQLAQRESALPQKRHRSLAPSTAAAKANALTRLFREQGLQQQQRAMKRRRQRQLKERVAFDTRILVDEEGSVMCFEEARALFQLRKGCYPRLFRVRRSDFDRDLMGDDMYDSESESGMDTDTDGETSTETAGRVHSRINLDTILGDPTIVLRDKVNLPQPRQEKQQQEKHQQEKHQLEKQRREKQQQQLLQRDQRRLSTLHEEQEESYPQYNNKPVGDTDGAINQQQTDGAIDQQTDGVTADGEIPGDTCTFKFNTVDLRRCQQQAQSLAEEVKKEQELANPFLPTRQALAFRDDEAADDNSVSGGAAVDEMIDFLSTSHRAPSKHNARVEQAQQTLPPLPFEEPTAQPLLVPPRPGDDDAHEDSRIETAGEPVDLGLSLGEMVGVGDVSMRVADDDENEAPTRRLLEAQDMVREMFDPQTLDDFGDEVLPRTNRNEREVSMASPSLSLSSRQVHVSSSVTALRRQTVDPFDREVRRQQLRRAVTTPAEQRHLRADESYGAAWWQQRLRAARQQAERPRQQRFSLARVVADLRSRAALVDMELSDECTLCVERIVSDTVTGTGIRRTELDADCVDCAVGSDDETLRVTVAAGITNENTSRPLSEEEKLEELRAYMQGVTLRETLTQQEASLLVLPRRAFVFPHVVVSLADRAHGALSLRRILECYRRRQQRIPEDVALLLTLDMLRATQALHRRGLLHCRLSPDAFLFRRSHEELRTDWTPERQGAWQHTGLALRYAEDAVIRPMYPAHCFFTHGDTKASADGEDRRVTSLPLSEWTLEIDAVGIVGCVYAMLRGPDSGNVELRAAPDDHGLVLRSPLPRDLRHAGLWAQILE
ncbi:MAG: hypothetical protein MHM6MM_003942 [Cercozoa sp. M6MM]